jgi:gliding motility-associated-like protein
LIRNLVDVFPQPKSGFKSLDSACIGTAINFTDTSNGIVRPVSSWSWDFGDGSTENIKDPIFLYRTTGTFKLSLFVTSSEGCISDTTYKSITVHPYPKVSAGPDLYVLDDGEKKISATASGAALRYSWDPTAYLNATNILQPTVVFPIQDIIYTLSVTGRGGCTSKDDVAITVLKLPKPPNTFTPNGDGINDRWDVKYLDQYPGCIVEIYTTQGQLVHRTTGYTNTWDGTFKGNILPSGTYYYVIDPKNGRKKIAGYVTILK